MDPLSILLAAVGGGGLVTTVIFAFKADARADRLLACRDLVDGYIKQNAELTDERNTEKVARTKAEAELADVRAQLVSTQAALAKADEENAENAADSVKNAPDPLRALGDVLSSSDRSNVSHTSDAGAGNGHQG